MVGPTVLKKKHSLKDVNLVPLIKRIREGLARDPKEYARMTTTRRLEDMDLEEVQNSFQDLTGEQLLDILGMAGRDPDIASARQSLHMAIIFANEVGQPKGQPLTVAQGPVTNEGSSGSRQEEVEAPRPKRARTVDPVPMGNDSLEQRIASLERSKTDDVEHLRDKVRALALQEDQSEPLILLTLDELSRVARKSGHSDADIFEELARQASRHRGKISIASLCLSVLGGKAADVITKALAKCVKEKDVEKLDSSGKEDKYVARESPLMNLYQNTPVFPAPQMGSFPGFMPMMPYQRAPRFTFGRGANKPTWRAKGPCHFCESTSHQVKDCELMKQAKKK